MIFSLCFELKFLWVGPEKFSGLNWIFSELIQRNSMVWTEISLDWSREILWFGLNNSSSVVQRNFCEFSLVWKSCFLNLWYHVLFFLFKHPKMNFELTSFLDGDIETAVQVHVDLNFYHVVGTRVYGCWLCVCVCIMQNRNLKVVMFFQSCAALEQQELLEELAESVGTPASWFRGTLDVLLFSFVLQLLFCAWRRRSWVSWYRERE